ncbi:bifunctional diaminohydroxyphosphoribosylaminopyrimidine deaminase/5-amino-6-(5-phosphoribosylamino)uracil reductase RibD [Corynebacterium halotolerans]|uniref:Riboflavin biosynthesis protein RibD n=1 Tax=Corynebacterium halotolerans YIM 70093 = DSM 44683 TaxID=1121362 RepID=M1P7D6_9CORY|nr:bifunctional diaminohydroxyphosphoribosylaminopyrimidine deaminase/5-amino-6-(5-phosphoribosylamino)uracil reductase RibD [Corynebacterium halotolerans]AGF72546.1 diaminohydroxyphosphoribosylaminopyrimidine deaminase/5-amino-6-(5-phosphoribosylamino)uracil reductase [Corynebacterium halotolerans YIM 70093 = DSM 44683]
MITDPALRQALEAALESGDLVRGTTSPNPPVGAAILSAEGELVGVGGTQPPGGPHAEVIALRAAGGRARGGTAVVTLEPCNHTGRTGPCSQALIDAGIARVFFVHPDPNDAAAGGADHLRAHGVEATRIDAHVPALRPWLAAVRLGRPHVTLKFAQTLDGFTAALDGTSRWITGEVARRRVHEDRRRRDAIVVGTGTALADNPSLTARTADGSLYPEQPRRVVIGSREIPADAAPNLHRLGFERHPEISAALAALWEAGARDVLVEGGARLASGFLAAGYVDAVQAYVAPTLLGAGHGVLAGAVGETLADAARFTLESVTRLGDDVLYEMTRKEVH